MRFPRVTKLVLVLAVVALVIPLSTNLAPRVHAYPPFSLTPVPASTAEGNTVGLVLSDTGAVQNIQYRFRFFVTDPAGTTVQSIQENYTTVPGQYSFSMQVNYPGPGFLGSNTLVGQYNAKVDELWPTAAPGVAGGSFNLTITNSSSYQRTQTVNIRASGYNASEPITVTIKTQATSTLVFSQLLAADGSGVVATSWKIPNNAVIDTYIVTVTGTTTVKKTPDAHPFLVQRATMIIGSITSLKSSYQRTETMNFSFQPKYPDGTVASTGAGLLTLTRPNYSAFNITASYAVASQTFNATYTTLIGDQGGTWSAALASHVYTDAYGNSGPASSVAINPQLTAVVLTIRVNANSTIAVGQQFRFNATITYPDGTVFQSGTVRAFLIYSGPPAINDSISVAFDTTSKSWLGTYRMQVSDTGGLWSLVISASDSASPPNSGFSSQSVTVRNTTTGPLTIRVTASTTVAVGQQFRLNATIMYSDGTILQSGVVRAFLTFSGPPAINDTIPVTFDTNSRTWVGTYTVQPTDSGGLWSLVIRASDSSTPSNSGYTTQAITVLNTSSGAASFPLYYFGIIAALIAGALAAVFLVFKKRGVKQTSLKIDLGAVQSEAGRIESSDFFQSVKDQVKKEKDEK